MKPDFQHIAVIDPAVIVAEVDIFNHLATLSPLPLTYHLPALFGMDSLHQIQNTKICGIIVLGSSASVNDQHNWQKQLHPWIFEKVKTGIPTLGLCYGHQLLAHLFGAKVGYLLADQNKVQGFRKIELSANPLWSKAASGELFVSHREEVKDCPEDFSIVGKSEQVAIDALAHKSLPIWSFQPHPEATTVFLKNVKYPHIEPENRFAFGRSMVGSFLKTIKKLP